MSAIDEIKQDIFGCADQACAWPTNVSLSDLRRARRTGDFTRVGKDFDLREVSYELLNELRKSGIQNGSSADFIFHRVRITDDLLFRAQYFDRSMRFFDCEFDGVVNFNHAFIRSLEMSGCHFKKGLSGRHIHVEDSFTLTFSKSDYTIDMTGAAIGEHFNFRMGYSKRSEGDGMSRRYALILRRCRISGDCMLDGPQDDVVNDHILKGYGDTPEIQNWTGFKAIGGVSLEGGIIGGRLTFTNAFLKGEIAKRDNDKSGDGIDSNAPAQYIHMALYGSQLRVDRNVFMDNQFTAIGEVRLRSVDFRGNLDIEDAHFIGCKVDYKDLTPRQKKDFDRTASENKNDAYYVPRDYVGLYLEDASIQKRLRIIDTEIEGGLILTGAQACVFENDNKSRPRDAGQLEIENFRYNRFVPHREYIAQDRVQWIKLQPRAMCNPNFNQQPWLEFAAAVKAIGDLQGARDIRRIFEKERTNWYFIRVWHLIDLRINNTVGEGPSYRWWKWFAVPFIVSFRLILLQIPAIIGRLVYAILRFIFGLTVEYGYQPQRGLILSIFVVLYGAFVFNDAFDRGGLRHAKEDVVVLARRIASDIRYEPFNPLLYSLDVFLPFIKFSQDEYWIVASNRKNLTDVVPQNLEFKKEDVFFISYSADALTDIPQIYQPFSSTASATRLWYWTQTTIGWVLTTLTGLAFTGILRRD
ncbi:MAG: hypothetical protein ACFB6R_03005 [Alphaproteobacteria bacterium]